MYSPEPLLGGIETHRTIMKQMTPRSPLSHFSEELKLVFIPDGNFIGSSPLSHFSGELKRQSALK